ncbi:PhoH family protein [Methylophilaceae bacterium]|jgi:PhoH-like ATPase|nr:PhoH family protein [Methylophilaceae bacterium]
MTKKNNKKVFVLDTNVLLHDPSSLFRFEEHDIYLPMVTIEELDNNKKGSSEVARNARQTHRYLEEIIAPASDLKNGCALKSETNPHIDGKLFLQTETISYDLPILAGVKADNQILSVVVNLKNQLKNTDVILVSKDFNIRIKARALGISAQDYFNDKVMTDAELLHTGIYELPENFWEKHSKAMKSWQEEGKMFYKITGPLCKSFFVNAFVFYDFDKPFYALVKTINGNSATLQIVQDYTLPKFNIWGIKAKNKEQNFALNLLMDPNIDFISLLGQAGTGKTLLALAAGLVQTLDKKIYSEIIMTRATVSVGDDIGFLPGTEEEKMTPWMGALEDNLDVLNESDDSSGDWGRAATQDLIKSRIKVKSLSFMRGRTFLNKYLIIDEAQNLTPKQMKTLVTRAGPGTKIVCCGNIAQIDTPYLTEGSSGLTYVVDRFKGWDHNGHVTLMRGERSRLADYAADTL